MNRFEDVRRIVAEASALSVEDITPETRLDALGIDSLEFLEMILSVKERCGVEIPDSTVATLTTVEDLCRAVEEAEVHAGN